LNSLPKLTVFVLCSLIALALCSDVKAQSQQNKPLKQDYASYPNWQLPAQLMQGPFEQSKTTPYLRRPLKSSGILTVNTQQGVLWNTEKPIKSMMVLGNKAVVNIDSQGQIKTVAGASDLNLVFVNAMVGNWAALSEHFALSLQHQAGKPCVTLTPIGGISAKTLKHIEACGSKTAINQLTLQEQGGATTKIALQLAPLEALSAKQQQLYHIASKVEE